MPKTVMIVEDNELNMKLFHDLLEAHGYRTIGTHELQAIPVVAVTAFAMTGDEERIREGGCEAYLSQPISVPKVIETIRRFLGVGQSMPAVSRGRRAERRRAT